MEALRASYGDASSSDSDASPPRTTATTTHNSDYEESTRLPPPPLSLLDPPNHLDYLQKNQAASRVRSFPHIEGNFALHVFIPVHIPSATKKDLALLLKRVAATVPELHAVDVDIPLNILGIDDQKLEQIALGRQFHISLGRTVPIRVHQIDSVLAMLRQKLQSQKRYWIDFSNWEVFVNDEHTRSFLSMEVITGGLPEITRQIDAVNEIYRLHNLPEFYQDPRPHISLAWAPGNISDLLKQTVSEELKRYCKDGRSLQRRIFTCKFDGIICTIGNKQHTICKFSD